MWWKWHLASSKPRPQELAVLSLPSWVQPLFKTSIEWLRPLEDDRPSWVELSLNAAFSVAPGNIICSRRTTWLSPVNPQTMMDNNKLLFNSPKLWDGLFSCNRQLQQYPSPFIMYAFRSYRESSRFCPPRIGTLSGQYQSERQDAMKQESMTSKFSVLEIHRGWGGLGTHLKYSSSDSGPPDLDSVNLGYSLGITPFLNPPCMIWRRLLMDRSLQNSASKDINP